MNELAIVRPRLAFEEEFGQYRNWWVRDARLVGNPLCIYLFLLSQDPARMPTQTESRKRLGLGKDAWISAKKRLLEAGFIVEVRDRYPNGFIDAVGRPKGGQKRYRLFLQDPTEDHLVDAQLALIELDEPYEAYAAATESNRVGFSEAVHKSPDQPDGGFSAPCGQPASDNPKPADNPKAFKEEKTRLGLVGSLETSNQPTNQPTREAEIDAELAALHPDLRLTFAQISKEVNRRVDLSTVDVVRAVEETVIRAAARGERVSNPASYAAAVIVRCPEQWAVDAKRSEPFAPLAQSNQNLKWERDVSCAKGTHWWGSEKLPEVDRAHCVECGKARRTVDPLYAQLEIDLVAVTGDW